MKIIDDKTGLEIQNPDLTQGWLHDETEPVEHPATDEVPEESHYETIAEYPNGGKDVRKVIDREGIPAKDAWTEQVPIQRYILYTAEELAAQEQARKDAEARAKLPETVAEVEDAMCEQDAANEERLSALEDAICELDAALNKE